MWRIIDKKDLFFKGNVTMQSFFLGLLLLLLMLSSWPLSEAKKAKEKPDWAKKSVADFRFATKSFLKN